MFPSTYLVPKNILSAVSRSYFPSFLPACQPKICFVFYRYVVYKQPLSLDRFFIHEVTPQEASLSKLDNSFILVCLNRFQQIVTVHTFQAETEQLKVIEHFLRVWKSLNYVGPDGSTLYNLGEWAQIGYSSGNTFLFCSMQQLPRLCL